MHLTLDRLLKGTTDSSFDDGIKIDAELSPLGGPGDVVKPAVYAGAVYQEDRRWPPPDSTQSGDQPQDVFVIDNVPSQANRLEEALRRTRATTGVPEMILDLTGLPSLPAHLPKRISSWHFPHRNADAYLRDSILEGEDFSKHELGRTIFAATVSESAALMSWWPQALLYGFWQSHLGKKRSQAKHARAWTSEIIGWEPAAKDTKVLGLKGDPLNLSVDELILYNKSDYRGWSLGAKPEKGDDKKKDKEDKLSKLGHGQVPFGDKETPDRPPVPSAVSFRRLTQTATVSFAQLRRVELGSKFSITANTAARALLVAMGLHAHSLAFGRGFALRSGANLRVATIHTTWLGLSDETLTSLEVDTTAELLSEAKEHARAVGVPLEGWDADPVILRPTENLVKSIGSSWPLHEEE